MQDAAELARFVDWVRSGDASSKTFPPVGEQMSSGAGSKTFPLVTKRFTDSRSAMQLGEETSASAPSKTHAAMRFSVFFTPWGEALIQRRYQDALISLSNSSNVDKVAIQTNLSADLRFTDNCDKKKLALWATFHPTETTRSRFLSKCFELISRGIRFSVGMVGLKEHFEEILAVRAELPADIYVWINAFKRVENYYSERDEEFLSGIDPNFATNNRYHESFGKACRTGSSVISVDGSGRVKRCHFVDQEIANIYEPDFEEKLVEGVCSNVVCGCHIGYVHMNELGLYELYGDGVLERIPADWQFDAAALSSPIVGGTRKRPIENSF